MHAEYDHAILETYISPGNVESTSCCALALEGPPDRLRSLPPNAPKNEKLNVRIQVLKYEGSTQNHNCDS